MVHSVQPKMGKKNEGGYKDGKMKETRGSIPYPYILVSVYTFPTSLICISSVSQTLATQSASGDLRDVAGGVCNSDLNETLGAIILDAGSRYTVGARSREPRDVTRQAAASSGVLALYHYYCPVHFQVSQCTPIVPDPCIG